MAACSRRAEPISPMGIVVNSSYSKLMQDAVDAHCHFKNEWNTWRRRPEGPFEPASVQKARNRFLEAADLLYQIKLEPLDLGFHERPNDFFDELCTFLEADITAFRCGYAKELFLQRLKGIPLKERQRNRLREIALRYCRSATVRREFRRWCRLMVKLADDGFVNRLRLMTRSG